MLKPEIAEIPAADDRQHRVPAQRSEVLLRRGENRIDDLDDVDEDAMSESEPFLLLE